MRLVSCLLGAVLLSRTGWTQDLGAPGEARFAREVQDAVSAAIGFYPPGKTPQPIPFPAGRQDAVLMLYRGTMRCSGAYISRTGHILTAAHCLGEGLSTKDREVSVVAFGHRPGSWGNYQGFSRRFQAAKETPLDKARPLVLGDWAIVKAERTADVPCVPADPAVPADRDPVWAMGYPGTTGRRGAPSSSFGGKYAVYGRKTGDIRLSAWFQASTPEERAFLLTLYQPALDSGDVILSDMDAYSGMSGGPIFDRRGRLAGLVTASGCTSGEFLDNSTFGISLQRVFADLRKAGLEPGLFFACPDAAPAP